jgi:hypothetical protein
MCPECISNIAMVAVAGITSTGGLTAFVMQKLTRTNVNASTTESFEQQESNRNHKENHDDDDRN